MSELGVQPDRVNHSVQLDRVELRVPCIDVSL